jgi:hypothetical protein
MMGERHSSDMAWHARAGLQPDFVEARVRRYLAGRAPLASGSLKLENRIAFIGDPALCADLACFADIVPLAPGDALAPDADLLLIGADWPRAGDPWREALLNLSPAPLRETIARFKAQGVPSALWITGEDETARNLSHLKDAVDAVFVAEGVRIEGARTLDPGVNVKLFNPFREDPADEPSFRFAVDGIHELTAGHAPEALLALLKPLFKFNTWLHDSSYHYQIPNMKLHPLCRRRFIGHLGDAERAALLSMTCGLYLPSALAAQRPVHFRKRLREAWASKTVVLGDGFTDTDVARLVEDPVGSMATAQRAWREALTHHTLFERLETILAAANVAARYNRPRTPRINAVMPTLRPEYIPFALDMFRRQAYGEASLTIVANGVSVPDDIARLVRETKGARLCAVPADKTIGYCMNSGIDQVEAEYWAKWDDDDVYGPHFLSDQMLQRKYLDFDVAGKAAIFNYIEEHDAIYLRDGAVRDTLSQHLGGGTLLVRNDGRYFAEDGRGSEDRAFVFLARERGDRVVSGDPFNFIQIRRKDASTHTWAQGPRAQDLRGPRRAGLSLDGVIA